MGEEKRHQMMQNLFGDQSEEEEEIDSEHESNPQPNYASDEAEGGLEPEGEGEVEVEGHGEAEAESDGEQREVAPDPGESEGEREQSGESEAEKEQSSQEVDVGDQREESEARDTDSDNKEDYGQRVAINRRRDIVDSESERSDEKQYNDFEDEEVDQARSLRSPSEEKDEAHVSQSAAEIRHVFGDSEDEDAEEYVARNDIEQDERRSPVEDEEGYDNYDKDVRAEDMVPEEDVRYDSEDEHVEAKQKEKPVGPPLEIEIPFRPPPGDPAKMNMIKVSNIMGIDPKPFDPKTYVEEDMFVTDESGAKKRIRLENNIVRYRVVKNRDGKTHYESNARFVRWSDGSLQLLIGNEVLDISVQDAQQDQNHLFVRHGKGILQSQGRILKKMRFIPSSLSSNSHRLLTALVDSRHKKVYKVKNCITDIDPEREKEKREKAENQNIKANLKLSAAREKVKRKYPQPIERRQLSTGYLEGALDEEEETDHYSSQRASRRLEEDLEAEAQRERRIMNAKKYQSRDIPRRPSMPSGKPSRRPVEFSESEREESEYETEGEEEERSPLRKRVEDPEDEYEEEAEEDEEEEQEEDTNANRDSEEEEEAEEPKPEKDRGSSRKRKGIESDEDSPPRKAPTHRRMAIVYDSDED